MATGISFAVKIHPRAKKNAITGQVGDALKVALTAPPVDGKANAACIEFFAKLFHNRNCWQGGSIAQRTERASQHVLR